MFMVLLPAPLLKMEQENPHCVKAEMTKLCLKIPKWPLFGLKMNPNCDDSVCVCVCAGGAAGNIMQTQRVGGVVYVGV